jgi:glycosyltransferase involved in cell wall biosynthesis
MINILLKGPLFSNCGYGYHSRQVYMYLKSRENVKIHCKILNWGNNPWLYSNIIDEIEKDILLYENTKFDESYQIQFPFEWEKVSDFDVGITAGIESNYCNPDMIHYINKMDKVIVPSNFSKNTFLNTSKLYNKEITTQISVIKESFHQELLEENEESAILQDIKTNFNFLVFGQFNSLSELNDRKNILKTIRVLVDTFKNNEEVGIILKTNLSNNSKLNLNRCKEILKNNFPKNNRKCKLYLIHGNISNSDINNIYKDKKIKALVSGTRSEGFGLVHLESAASGLPIITTNWSGYLDFLEDNFLKVKYDLVKCPSNNLFCEESKWAEFNSDSMKKKLLTLYKNYDLYKENSMELKNKIIQEYNLNAIIDTYKIKFKE